MKISIAGKTFQFSLFGLVLYLLLVSFLSGLGFWQLGRGEQKQLLIQQQQTASLAEPINLNQQRIIDGESDRYRRVVVKGHYDVAHQFLIDNQVMDGKSGFLVLTPLIVDGFEQAILVNRGWVALGNDRRQLPDVAFEAGPVELSARINHFPLPGIKLAGMEMPGQGWPSVLQLVDSAKISEKLGYPIADYQLELSADAAHGYRREWRTSVAIPPEKHQAYAVQWFGLAIALSFLFVWISFRKTQ